MVASTQRTISFRMQSTAEATPGRGHPNPNPNPNAMFRYKTTHIVTGYRHAFPFRYPCVARGVNAPELRGFLMAPFKNTGTVNMAPQHQRTYAQPQFRGHKCKAAAAAGQPFLY